MTNKLHLTINTVEANFQKRDKVSLSIDNRTILMLQSEALELLKLGKNIFLTGAAGSGKTYLLNNYIRYLRENQVTVAVTASTGIAATHLEGSTIHAWSGIGVKDTLTQKDLEKLLTSDRIKRNYKKTKVLIIDEISMLHKDQLDMVDTIARAILRLDSPFGGMQLVVCGDFFQLPPVSKGRTEETEFAFESNAWRTGDFHVCYLHEQHRQGDDPLRIILNDIRNGTAGEHTKIPLRTRYKKEPHGAIKATRLYSRNINVDAINEQELENLSGKEKKFKMRTDGFTTLVEGLKKSCLALERLTLKINAEVMFIKNDVSGRYTNGTRGVVIAFDKSDGWPLVKTNQGETITAFPEEWKYEENGSIRATLTQVPLRLAWAITIHKSQGMTLDAAEMDLGDTFEPGMGYVALSRVRSLNGLKLMNLNNMALTVHPKILEQDKIFNKLSEDAADFLKTLSTEALNSSHQKILTDRFDAGKVSAPSKNNRKKDKISTHLVTLAFLKENIPIESIAKKREFTVGTIITHLEKLNGLKLLDGTVKENIKSSLPEKDFETIYEAVKLSEDGELMSLYNHFGGKYSYQWIRLIRLYAT